MPKFSITPMQHGGSFYEKYRCPDGPIFYWKGKHKDIPSRTGAVPFGILRNH
jgi:hypothetical protein